MAAPAQDGARTAGWHWTEQRAPILLTHPTLGPKHGTAGTVARTWTQQEISAIEINDHRWHVPDFVHCTTQTQWDTHIHDQRIPNIKTLKFVAIFVIS